MADTLSHRGPDDAGIWTDSDAGIAIAHRRLSIIDPSPAGHQPMLSSCGRFVLSFNGEIYNHLPLRRQLDAERAAEWRGRSDTETLLQAIARWGLIEALARSTGMFALALWDRENRTLALARDRIGEKPLYFGWTADAILFGSELKALRAAPHFRADVAPQALALYLRHNHVPAPWSILRNVFKVEPGVIVTLDAAALGHPPSTPPGAGSEDRSPGIRCERFWSLDTVFDRAPDETMGADEAVDGLHAKLRDAVRQQMVADMPVGAFLSGGIDSSLIVALMCELSTRPVRTFTIGFRETGFDEAPFARAVARHLGTEHSELYLDPSDILSIVPDIPAVYDEPFADSSQLPSMLLSRMARQSVKVALSGDGGDELFCGYNRYLFPQRLWSLAGALPGSLRRTIGSTITAIPPERWDRLAQARLLPAIPMAGIKAHKIGRMLQTPARTIDIYRAATEEWDDDLPLNAAFSMPPLADERDTAARTPEERMMRWDMAGYLPGDILTKLDRASMSASLEARVPFLDHHVVEQAWRTPIAFKKRDGQSKWLLRQLLRRHLPDALIDRPKAGFALPLGQWLRAELRGWGEAMLGEAMRDDPLLDAARIRQRWAEHQSGSHDWTPSLWGVLMYRAWMATC
jgi:asparagine synthase (glutamine-hydrolysing)